MADLIEDAIDEKYGPRCDTFEADCWTCQVWKQYDALHEAGERARERALEEAAEVALAYADGQDKTVRATCVAKAIRALKGGR